MQFMSAGKIKTTGSFIYDLTVALSLPKRESENELVEYLLRKLEPPMILLERVKVAKRKISKLTGESLTEEFNQCLGSSFEIEEKLEEFVESIRLFKKSGTSSQTKTTRRKEWTWYLSTFPRLVACVDELSKRASTKEWGSVTHPVGTIYHLMFNKKPRVEATISNIQKNLGIDVEDVVFEAVKSDMERIKNFKDIQELPSVDRERVDEFYDEEFNNYSAKRFGNLTPKQIGENMWNDDKDLNYLPHKVSQKMINELTEAASLRQLRYNLRKKGESEEDIEEKIKSKNKQFSGLKYPLPIHVAKVDNDEDGIEEGYIPTPPERNEMIKYVNLKTSDYVFTILIEARNSLFRNSATGRDYIDYLIDNKDNDDARFTNREIARATGHNEDTIGRVRQRLEKAYPIIRKLIQY